MPPITLSAIPFPAIDPVALQLGPLAIHWYGIAYIVGIVLGWRYARALAANAALWGGRSPITPEDLDDLAAVILGSRCHSAGVVAAGRRFDDRCR